MKFRQILNAVTFTLIIVILWFAREQLVTAWHLLKSVNLWILALLIPTQFLSYFFSSEIFFTYLRSRGKLKETSRMDAASMALELNFVNHVFPSGGVSGMSYMVWRLKKLDVSAGQATMAQIIRLALQIGVFFVFLAIALVFVSADSKTNGFLVMMSSIVVTSILFIIFFGSYVVGSESKMRSFASWLARTSNTFLRKVTFGHAKKVVSVERLEGFLLDLHHDFLAIKKDKKLLVRPIIICVIYTIVDVSLFMVTFFALGKPINPAVLVIGYGAATLAGFVVLTPGGAGAYEVIMIGILTSGGVAASTAFAGVILTRAILLTGTIAVGWFVYQRALKKYGTPDLKKIDEEKIQEIDNDKHHSTE